MSREKLRHIGSHGGQAGKVIHSRRGKDEPQRALMLINRLRLESFLSRGTDDEGGDVSTNVVEVGLISFIKSDDQQPVTLKRGVSNQRSDVGLQPRIRLRERAVVGIIHQVGCDGSNRVANHRFCGPSRPGC